MTQHAFHMQGQLKDVDPMVTSLKACVEGVLTGDVLLRFEISIVEALTNLIEHAAAGRSDAPIEITLTRLAQSVTVTISDPPGAPPFDPRDHDSAFPTLDPMAEGGRGIGLILHCADTVSYGPIKGRNHLSLGFSRSAR